MSKEIEQQCLTQSDDSAKLLKCLNCPSHEERAAVSSTSKRKHWTEINRINYWVRTTKGHLLYLKFVKITGIDVHLCKVLLKIGSSMAKRWRKKKWQFSRLSHSHNTSSAFHQDLAPCLQWRFSHSLTVMPSLKISHFSPAAKIGNYNLSYTNNTKQVNYES